MFIYRETLHRVLSQLLWNCLPLQNSPDRSDPVPQEPLRHLASLSLAADRCAVHSNVHTCTAVLIAPKWVPCLTHPCVPRAWHPVYVC